MTITASAQNYVAIGDSLAAGQTPYQEIDIGYTGMIALAIQPDTFSKKLAFPGYTTRDVLKQLNEKEAKKILQDATLVTISAGANNVLPLIKRDVRSGMVAFEQTVANFALNGVRKDMEKILQRVQQLAPQADVYVMGYYFAYPYVHEQQKQGVVKQIATLNQLLQQTAQKQKAHFVAVDEQFGTNARSYLPNVADIHPNLEGYRVMANAFLQQYSNRQIQIPVAPPANPISFEEIIAQEQHNK